MSEKTISFFISDNDVCYEFAEILKEKSPYYVKIIKETESSQAGFLQAVCGDDIVIVDCTIPENGESSVYPLLVAQINIFDHILCFSRNCLPLNVVPHRKCISDDNNKIRDWLNQQISDLITLIDSGKHYCRIKLDLNKSDDALENVSRLMEQAVAFNEKHKQNIGKVLISYRNHCYDGVINFVDNIKKYTCEYSPSDFHIISPDELCQEKEALTPMRRWMLTGLLDDRIRETDELWIYGTQDYWNSWWTLAELLLVLYFNQTSRNKQITIKYIDTENNYAIKEPPVKFPDELSEKQIKKFARLLSNTRPDTMGPEAKKHIAKKIQMADNLLRLKNYKFLGLPIGRFFFNLKLQTIQYCISKAISITIPEEERQQVFNETMDMYKSPEKLLDYFKDAIYSDKFWNTLSCQLTICTPAYRSLTKKTRPPKEITLEVVNDFLEMPMLECINMSEKKMINELKQGKEIKISNSITTETKTYFGKIIEPHYLWLATRMGKVQGVNGLEILNRFILDDVPTQNFLTQKDKEHENIEKII